MLIEVVGRRRGQAGARGRHVQDLLGARVHVGGLQFTGLDGRDNLSGARQTRGWHLQAATGTSRLNRTVRTAPVRDDHAVEAPLGTQDVGEKVLVLVRVDAVDEVVGAHDRPRLGSAAHDLKAGQVDLTHRARVHDRVRRHASQLLGVNREVLRAGGGLRRLDSFDEARGHASGEDRVLGEVLEVTPTQGRALDVQAGAEQDVHAETARLHTQRLTHLTRQVGIPGRRERGGRREAGRLLGLGDAQVIRVAELAAHAVGPVAHHEGGDVRSGDRARVPGAGTGQKRRGLQEGEVTSVRQCCVFHRRELPFVLHRGCRRWFQCGPLSLRLTDRAHDLSFAGPVLHVRGLLSLR